MAKEREAIDQESKWNVEALYPDLQAWEAELRLFTGNKEGGLYWPELKRYSGKIDKEAKQLSDLLTIYFDLERKLVKLYTYAHLRHDENVANEVYKDAFDRVSLLYFDFKNETTWIEPEILQIPDSVFADFLVDEQLKPYHIHLKKIVLLKDHTLTSDKEQLLALANKALETPSKAFGLFNNADLKFPPVKNEKGEEKELTHGTYQLYLQSKDRTLRKNGFITIHKTYAKFENTVSELISGQVQKHLFQMRARKFPSCLAAALTPHQIDVSVYHNLIKTVRDNLPILHRYVGVRKKILQVDTLHFYDLYVSLLPEFEKKYTYPEAKKLILDSVKPLGSKYQENLERGLGKDRWIDCFENVGKRSGAYSSGCFDSFPYILMNFQGTLRDVMTLSHEAGHSMHSFLSNQNQSFQYSHYPIFVAEVASTFHEELLFRHLLEKAQSKEEKCYLINQKIDDIRATLFRQTQFAEFELHLHNLAEEGVPLTAASLKLAYRTLNQSYYGPDLVLDPEVDVEFLRIPHFYYNFYVYQYATGVSAAYALALQVLEEGEKARDKYLTFLSSGSSAFPLDLLKIAGVNMSESKPIQKILNRFDSLVKELESLL